MKIPIPNQEPFADPVRVVAINEAWYSFLLGIFETFDNESVWEGTDEQISYARQHVRQIMVQLGDSGILLEDVRISSDGKLEKRVGGVWYDAGDVDTIDSASASGLPSGSEPTAHIVDGELQLGIPQGADGMDGEDGTDGTKIANVTVDILEEYEQPVGQMLGETLALGIPVPATGDCGCSPDTIINNMYSVPEEIELDKVCKAAFYLSKMYSDTFGDILEITLYALEEIANDAQAVLALGDSWLWIAQDVAESFKWFLESLTIPPVQYLSNNVNDVDAIALVAEQFYCAMLASWNDEPQFDSMFSHIEFPTLLPLPVMDVEGEWNVWSNFAEMIDFLIGLGTGEAVGWGVLSYAKVCHDLLPEALEKIALGGEYKDLIANVLNRSSKFVIADCEDFCGNWSHEFDFRVSNCDWDAVLGGDNQPRATYVNGEGWASIWDHAGQHLSEMRIIRTALPSFVKKVKIVYTLAGVMGWNFAALAGEIALGQGNNVELVYEPNNSSTEWRIDALHIGSQETFVLHYLKVWGTGEDPFA